MRKPYDQAYLTEILEAELAAVIAHHTEMANLEWECAKLIERRRAARAWDEGDDESDLDQ